MAIVLLPTDFCACAILAIVETGALPIRQATAASTHPIFGASYLALIALQTIGLATGYFAGPNAISDAILLVLLTTIDLSLGRCGRCNSAKSK